MKQSKTGKGPTRAGAAAREARVLRGLAEGKTQRAIAAEMGIGEVAVSQILARPHVRAQVEAMQAASMAEAREILRRNASRVAQRLVDMGLHGSGGDNAAVRAAEAVLDRAGVTATQVLDLTVRGDVRELSDDDLDRLIAERLGSRDSGTGATTLAD